MVEQAESARRHRDTPRPPSQIVKVVVPRSAKPEFKELGGSDSDHFNQMLAEQTLEALWVIAALPGTPERARLEAKLRNTLAVAHLVARGPTDEAETALARARTLATEAGDAGEVFAAAFGQWYLNQQRMNLPAIVRLAQELLDGLGPKTPARGCVPARRGGHGALLPRGAPRHA